MIVSASAVCSDSTGAAAHRWPTCRRRCILMFANTFLRKPFPLDLVAPLSGGDSVVSGRFGRSESVSLPWDPPSRVPMLGVECVTWLVGDSLATVERDGSLDSSPLVAAVPDSAPAPDSVSGSEQGAESSSGGPFGPALLLVIYVEKFCQRGDSDINGFRGKGGRAKGVGG